MHQAPTLETIVRNPLVVQEIGSIACGKSTFLSVLHATLCMHNAGIRIDKDRLKGTRASNKHKVYDRLDRGLLRSNATDRPDALIVYGAIGTAVWPFQFLAPGGHRLSGQGEAHPDALLYFVDLGLAKATEKLNTFKTLMFDNSTYSLYVENTDIKTAIRKWMYRFSYVDDHDLHDRDVPQYAKWFNVNPKRQDIDALIDCLAEHVVDMPRFGQALRQRVDREDEEPDRESVIRYKGELWGSVLESLIDAQHAVNSALEQGTPVVGVCTHQDVTYKDLPHAEDALLAAARERFGQGASLYAQYMNSKGQEISLPESLPSGPSTWFCVGLMRKIPYYRGDNPLKKQYWQGKCREVLTPRNPGVLAAARHVMAEALHQKGVDASQLRIVTFSGRQNEQDLTVPYEQVRNLQANLYSAR